MTAIAYDRIADELAVAIPEFAGEIEEHRADQGEVLPHLLFGDLVRFVERAAERGDWQLVHRPSRSARTRWRGATRRWSS